MSTQIVANPLASTPSGDPLGGEARRVVSLLLIEHGRLSDWKLFQEYQKSCAGQLTREQLRAARKELFEAGLVTFGGRKLLAGEDLAPAQTWKWVERTSYRVGPRGESQPVSDHSNDPLVPEVLA